MPPRRTKSADVTPDRNRVTKKEIKEIIAFITSRKNWNGGAGLIVPPVLDKELKKLGIKEGYTISKPLPTKRGKNKKK